MACEHCEAARRAFIEARFMEAAGHAAKGVVKLVGRGKKRSKKTVKRTDSSPLSSSGTGESTES